MKRLFHDFFCFFPICNGVIALIAILSGNSEEKNSLIWGFSGYRLILAVTALLFTVFAVLVFCNRRKKLTFLYYLIGFFLPFSFEILLFSRFPSDNTHNLIPLIAQRCFPLLMMLILSSFSWAAALYISGTPVFNYYVLYQFVTSVLVYWCISSHIDRFAWQIDLQGNSAMCFSLIFFAVIWAFCLKSSINRRWKTAFGCLFFLILGYSVIRSTGMWMGRNETPPKAYWNELAEAFLHKQLYLEHPSGTHDLTLYKGKWYVPNPPLPAVLLMPFVLLKGNSAMINMCKYSAWIAGINAALLFLMLIFAFEKKDILVSELSDDDTAYPKYGLEKACWVTILFIFGTDHFWLGTTGQMWFISQLLVVLFTILACICVIRNYSPILAGISLGLGILCRPNIFPVWFCLLGLWLQQNFMFPRFDWKKVLHWCLKSDIPVLISAGLLLLYNKVRFDDWMDFGYVTINGADWILDAVRKYGMFHPHFIPVNAEVMLFKLPELDFSGERFFFQPGVAGYSIFLMTPPIIYSFRSFRKNWFSAAAWTSVLLSVGLLLFYHNTGAEQIGYRYLLDITAPLSLLTAAGIRGKTGWLFKLLTVFAIGLSFIAIYWWYLGRV